MKPYHLILAACLAIAPAHLDAQVADIGQDAEIAELAEFDSLVPRDAAGLSLDDFLWIARPIIIFADTPADPRVAEQLQLLADRPEALLERDVVIIVDTDPDARSEIRLALRPRGFSLVVLAMDGTIGLRRPALRDVREIVRAIDNFQLRQEELTRGE